MTLLQTELIAGLAHSFPDAVAWRNLADGTELTLATWHRQSNRLARGLQELGVARGDRVGLVIGDEEPLEWLVSYLGIHKSGAVAVPLLARLGPAELPRILQVRRRVRRPVQRGEPGRPGGGAARRDHDARGRRRRGPTSWWQTARTSP